MYRYAQTNLQLYAQLTELGCSDEQLIIVRNAYKLAMRLFTSRFRANDKPFLAHLVGTASILARHGAPLPVVAAGLLHAAYLQGEFGDGQIGITNTRRRKVRQAVGEEVEKLIAEYTCFAWNHQAIIAMRDGLDTLSPKQRALVLIRLANDLEDRLDLGMLYSGKQDRANQSQRDEVHPLATIADQLGHSELAQHLAAVYAEQDATSVPDVLRTDHTVSYTGAPASHRRRILLVVGSQLNKARRLVKAPTIVRQLSVKAGCLLAKLW